MGNRIVYYGEKDGVRTRRALELAPSDLDVGCVDPHLPQEERLAALADCQVMISNGLSVTVEDARRLPKLRLLQLMSAGFDRIDVTGLREAGVEVCNNSPAIANSVAEQAITLMLAVYKRFNQSVEGVRAGTWQEPAKSGPFGTLYELAGRTVGIVGLGNIGSMVARRLRGFDTTTLYHDIRTVPPELEAELNITRVSLDELLGRSDIVTAHVPLYSATRGMFGRAEFKAMRPDAVFINTCRGPVHDEPALIEALRAGEIRAAGLDVTEIEPTPLDSPLLKMENVIVTPHIAGSSQERVDRAILFSYENARRVFAGQPPESRVELLT